MGGWAGEEGRGPLLLCLYMQMGTLRGGNAGLCALCPARLLSQLEASTATVCDSTACSLLQTERGKAQRSA